MNEDEASCMRGEKLSTAVQSLKDNLTCRICLELFYEPVTIKCGHKFCRACILRVTNNENSSCPFCNTKIQKRSIPKDANGTLEKTVQNFLNLVQAIEIDSGIDALQPYNKLKNTKEGQLDYSYSKPSTSKVEGTPSTSKGSSSNFNQKLAKSKTANPVRSRLSLTKKKTDNRSPNQSADKNTLHKYLSNKQDAVPDQVVQSQEKVKNWLESCTSDDSDSIRQPIQAPSTKLNDNFAADPITTPPDPIFGSPQVNEIKESDVSPMPPSETSSGSRYKETQMRIQEAETMAKKKKVNLSLKEKNNVKTPSSVPATLHLDADDWRRVKRVGREMQVKTFKTLNVSIEKYSPPVVDDTVIYNSTNNDSKNISHDSEPKNSSTDKTPLQTKKGHPLKSENNNLSKKSPQIVTEDYRHRSMDSSSSPKQDIVASFRVDEDQLNEIIGVTPSTSVSKTPEKIRISLKSRSNLKSKLNLSSPSKNKSNSGQELSEDESSNCDSKTTVINLKNSPSKKKRLSLNKFTDTTSSKSSSLPATPDKKSSEKEKESSSYVSTEKPKNKLLQQSTHNKINSVTQTLKSTKPTESPKSNNLVNKRSSSSSNGCRFVFKKLGKICKKKNNVPFYYFGKLEKDKCLIVDDGTPNKSAVIVKSIIPVCIDYKPLMENKNVANLEEFSSDDSHSKAVSPKSNLQSKSPTKCDPANNIEEAMNIDEDIDVVHKAGPSNQQMEIDDTLPPAKIIFKNNSEKMNSESEIDVEKIEESSPKPSRKMKKTLKNKSFENVPPPVDENVPEPSKHSDDEDNMSRNSNIAVENFDPIIESSSKANPVNNISSNSARAKLSTAKKSVEKTDVQRAMDDLISISSDDSEAQVCRTNTMQKVDKVNYSKSSRKSGQRLKVKSDLESCAESEISVTSDKKVDDPKPGCSSTSSSSLKTTKKKKRTHSESSNDDDDLNSIINKWVKNDKDQVSKKPKILLDSEEILNRNASKVRNRSRTRCSFSSSSDDQEDTVVESKQQQSSLNSEKVPAVKSRSTEVNINKLTTMPSSMQSADLFESNEQTIKSSSQSLKKQFSQAVNKITKSVDSGMQSNKDNVSDRSRENITLVDTRQLKRRKSVTSKTADNEDKENNEYNYNKTIKATEELADEIESSQKRRKSIAPKDTSHNDREDSEYKRVANPITSIKATEGAADEIESSQKDKDKTLDNFDHESNPCFVRDSLLNITQEQLAYKNVEKDLFGIDLSKINEYQENIENQEDNPLTPDKFSTPHRKPKQSEENDDFDSDNIAPTPVVKKRQTIRFPSSSHSSPKSEINASEWSSPRRRNSLIPAITPMKNRKCYPLCHSTPMISSESPDNQIHSQPENIKIICSSLSAENLKLVHDFVDRFKVQCQTNFDKDVTHVIVRVHQQTKSAPKTFKYIQGIAFKKRVVSLEWLADCLAKGKLLDADNEKYDVLDPDILESGSKKSRLSSQKIFRNFVFYCLEPFEKVPLSEFKELLIHNGAEIVRSVNEFHLHKDKIKIIIAGSDELNDDGIALLAKTEAVAVFFEWIVDSLSQYQILSLPPYLCETTIDKARCLGLPPELLIEEETLEGEEYEDDN